MSLPSHLGKSDDVELDVVPSFTATGQKDGLALARLGKVAVLKVNRPCLIFLLRG